MKKIIQICSDAEWLYALTQDGKVYNRRIKNKRELTKQNGDKYITGTIYWHEIPIEENF